CELVEELNISRTQLDYSSDLIRREGLEGRVRFYLCNTQDVDLLPDPEIPFDLVNMRGVIEHLTYENFERTIGNLAKRMDSDGKLVISAVLYRLPIETLRTSQLTNLDLLACNHKKNQEYVTEVLEGAGFEVEIFEEMPKAEDVITRFQRIRSNIILEFPVDTPQEFEEFRGIAESLTPKLEVGVVKVYNIVARLKH
ncbi:unnamed protein product, partial [marine sediment metagenome]